MKSFCLKHAGELCVFGSIIPWSLFAVITKLAFEHIPVLFVAAWSTALSIIYFSIVLTVQGGWGEWRKKDIWKDILLGSIIIGVLFYGLFFWGLQYTSAGNASIIGLTEVLFTFLFFGIWKKEKYKGLHLVGAALMIIGAFCILFPGEFSVSKGDLFLLLVMMIPPVGNHYQKQARKKVSAGFAMFIRSIISTLFLFLIAFAFEIPPSVEDFRDAFPWLIINGVFVLGISKHLFIESLHYLNVSQAIALGSATPAFTLLFAFLLLQEIPTVWQLAGLVPIALGVILLTKKSSSFLPRK